LVIGCGRAGQKKTYPVTGTVTWNGDPIPEGYIVFMPEDRTAAPESSTITAGTFRFRSTAGTKKVEISADRQVGERDPVMNTVARESYIPPWYNEETTLAAEVTPDGDNRFEFSLTDKKPAAAR
jgi:hypothetical protein